MKEDKEKNIGEKVIVALEIFWDFEKLLTEGLNNYYTKTETFKFLDYKLLRKTIVDEINNNIPVVSVSNKYDWKLENPQARYIDSIKWEEAKTIAHIALGMPSDFKLLKLDAECNGNNIPHVKLYCKYYDNAIHEYIESYVGIFHNLNTYVDDRYHQAYCQRELFETYKQMGF